LAFSDQERRKRQREAPPVVPQVTGYLETIMRNTILLGTTAVLFALGGANAYAMGGGSGNVSPEASPYALLAPQTVQPYATTEGRAAYVSHGYGVPAPAPAPGDDPYHSRGW
jgi:hypothetical protein